MKYRDRVELNIIFSWPNMTVITKFEFYYQCNMFHPQHIFQRFEIICLYMSFFVKIAETNAY
jgi:hypothetical protein